VENKQKTIFSVIINKNKLNCINTLNGSSLGSLSYSGSIMSGPIVTGDRCVVTYRTSNNNIKGVIYKLPTFSIITTFNY
jgi:hypothetical protein